MTITIYIFVKYHLQSVVLGNDSLSCFLIFPSSCRTWPGAGEQASEAPVSPGLIGIFETLADIGQLKLGVEPPAGSSLPPKRALAAREDPGPLLLMPHRRQSLF